MRRTRTSEPSRGFSEWLERCLAEAGLDPKEAAARAGITPSYLSMLKTGRRTRPSAEKVVSLASVLGADPGEALKAANLPPARDGARPGPGADDGQGASTVPVVSCAIQSGGTTFQAEVRENSGGMREYRVRIVFESGPGMAGESAVRERLLGEGETLAFSPGPGAEPITCAVDRGPNELVLRIPLSLLVPPAPSQWGTSEATDVLRCE